MTRISTHFIKGFITPSLKLLALTAIYAMVAYLTMMVLFHVVPSSLYTKPPAPVPLLIKLVTLGFNLAAVALLYKTGTRELPTVTSQSDPEFTNFTRSNPAIDALTQIVVHQSSGHTGDELQTLWDFKAPSLHRWTGAPPTEQVRQVTNKQDRLKSKIARISAYLLTAQAALLTYVVYLLFSTWGGDAFIVPGAWSESLYQNPEAAWLGSPRMGLQATPAVTFGLLAWPIGIVSLSFIVDVWRRTPKPRWEDADWADQTTQDPVTAVTLRTSAQASTVNVGGVIVDLHRPFNASLTQTRERPRTLTLSLQQGQRRARLGALVAPSPDDPDHAAPPRLVPVLDTLAPILCAEEFLKVWAVVQHHRLKQNDDSLSPITLARQNTP